MSSAPPTTDSVWLSVVVPIYNEADNVEPLLQEIIDALAALGRTEVIFVDDASDDDGLTRLAGPKGRRLDEHPALRLIRHDRRAGQSAAVRTGVRAARGEWIATLDGDGQNDPRDIPRLVAARDAAGTPAPSLVGGLRLRRQDGWSKRVASRIANRIRQALLRDGCDDTGCGIKLFRRDQFLDLPYFAAMHRFLPALFQAHGHRAIFAPVHHRPRERGTSKYNNLRRGLIGVVDLLGVCWLLRRTALAPRPQEVDVPETSRAA